MTILRVTVAIVRIAILAAMLWVVAFWILERAFPVEMAKEAAFLAGR